MAKRFWVVSDPPHGDVDHKAAAKVLGLPVAEARLKLNFGAPELWLAHEERSEIASTANELREAGVSVRVIDGSDLLTVPPPLFVEYFRFEAEALTATSEEAQAELGYDHQVWAVLCLPPPDFMPGETSPRLRGSSVRTSIGQHYTSALIDRVSGVQHARSLGHLGELEQEPCFDLYWLSEDRLQRISISPARTEFSGLGESMKPRGRDNMEALALECGQRFAEVQVDRRLVNVRPRRRVATAPAELDSRQLFSFGTVGLRALLEAIDPGLAEVTQYDLGSRLSYLMSQT